jgi:hypothetical protein
MAKWQIKMKSAIGQQLETAYNKELNRFVKETSYAEPSFEATREEAHALLSQLQNRFRCKWMRIYQVIG